MALVVVIIIAGAALGGVILCDLWEWFIVPLGIPALQGIWHGAGIMLTAGLLTYSARRWDENKGQDEDGKANWGNVIASLAGMLLIWGIGAIWHSWMM